PDRCALKIERRTIPGEDDGTVTTEMDAIFARLRAAHREFDGSFTRMFSRPQYAIDADHPLPRALAAADAQSNRFVGRSFWTDAAVLGGVGSSSVLVRPA